MNGMVIQLQLKGLRMMSHIQLFWISGESLIFFPKKKLQI